MKKLISVILVSFLILFFYSCASVINSDRSYEGYSEKNFGKEFSSSELKEDLNLLVTNIEQVHPDPFYNVNEKVFRDEVNKVENSISVPMNRFEFYKKIAPLVALFKNGHTSVMPPFDEWNYFVNHNGRYFPFVINHDSLNGVSVRKELDSAQLLKPGTRILRINHLAADSLFSVFKTNAGGERDIFVENITRNRFQYFLWMYGIYSPYNISCIAPNSTDTETVIVEGKTYVSDTSISEKNMNEVPYAFKFLPDSIGYIDYRSMYDEKSNPFEGFLNKVFTELKTKPAKGLIIDLRRNGGGNSYYGEILLSYITGKPYKMADKKIWKVSAQYRSYMRSRITWWLRWVSYPPAIWLMGLFFDEARMFTASDGEPVELRGDITEPEKNPLRYNGKVCFLIGSGTYSSAMMLANAVGDFKLATLIGEETAGIPNDFGEVYPFQLPNTKLQIYIPSALFVRANGNVSDKRGVLPDIEVKQNSGDTDKKIDTVLEAAKKWILSAK